LISRSIPKRYIFYLDQVCFFFFAKLFHNNRTFTQSAIARNFAGVPSSLQAFTEEELMLKETGTRILH
jgi:hypothetical protein